MKRSSCIAPRLHQLVAATALILAASSAGAVTRSDLHRADLAQVNHQYRLATQGLAVAAQAQQRHAELLGLDPDSQLEVINHRQDRLGTDYYRYQQTFRGMPIFGEQIVVSEGRGVVRNLFGRKVSGLASELPRNAPSIGKARALQLGKSRALGARVASMKIEREQATETVFIGDDNRAHLAYQVSFFADQAGGGAPTRPFVILDAGTGAVLKQWDGLAHDAIATGPGGNAKTGQYEYGLNTGYNDVAVSAGTCTMSNATVKTINLNGGDSETAAYSFACPRNSFKAINSAYAPLNDAHYFGKAVVDMYGAYVGVAPLDQKLVMRVHYGNGYDNAFWDGASMTFGDGAGTFYPLVALDISAHEISHGFTEHNSNLTYSGMPGAINEAFSDMAGEAAEYYLRGANDFQIGAQVFKAYGALRYMANPPADGRSIDNSSKYRSDIDVHYSSGVYNKAFYSLARTAGWNTERAFRVFARANQLYWTSSITFNQGACGVQAAANDLGLPAADVAAAFAVVGVACGVADGDGGEDVDGGQLDNGAVKSGISASSGYSVNYRLDVPVGATNLKVAMAGGIGDADLYVRVGSAPTDTAYNCAPYTADSNETCVFDAPQAGTYYIRLKSYSSFSGVSLAVSYTLGSNALVSYASSTPAAIPDLGTLTSTINVSGRSGNAKAASKLAVNISHPSRGELVITLIAPDGSIYPVKASNKADNGANLVATYTVNLSAEAMNGAWKLQVQDKFRKNAGTLNGWSLEF